MNNSNIQINAPSVSVYGNNKDTKINQLQKVYSTLFVRPMTRLEVAQLTGIERANVCRYVAELRKQNNVEVVRLGVCPITKHSRVQFLTTNPELSPQKKQLDIIFDNTQFRDKLNSDAKKILATLEEYGAMSKGMLKYFVIRDNQRLKASLDLLIIEGYVVGVGKQKNYNGLGERRAEYFDLANRKVNPSKSMYYGHVK